MEEQEQQSKAPDDADSEQSPWPRRVEGHIARRVGSGFLVLIPLLTTFLILMFVFGFIGDFFRL